ncbi:Ig-like domain-containing protein [Arachidicoccus terrestris]|uniref:Ig-like domain-containing protein n=1 Tax=Arachidicoccus terrestris TaxID=2875539 RepID=UPI001CC36AD2|nr:Ig-like domain-containing protein [Arachidicoccus terrestris]UAY55138.1 Ig-like domain-containing protein [Arachidicoccus terrestris]
MNKVLAVIFSFFILIGILMQLNSCAVIVPPGGGPRDTLSPILLSATPADSTLNFKAKSIVLTFDEYVQVQDIFNNLIVSPVAKNIPNVKGKLREVTIEIKDTLEPNTTYSYNFGNAIQDVNENNPLRNFTYVFSTGDHLDTDSITGKVVMAEDGAIDSTLMVVLYRDLSDTAVLKNSPRYYARLDSLGRFAFHFLPKENYHLFAVENSYMKNYGDSTAVFAFMDSVVSTKNDSVNNGITLYAFRAFPKEQEGKRPAQLSEKQREKRKEQDAKKPLTVALNLEEGKQSLLKPLTLQFSKPLESFKPELIQLTDTNFVPVNNFTIVPDSTDSTNSRFIMNRTWDTSQGKEFALILPIEAATDSFKVQLAKADTVKFTVKTEHDYATLQLKFPDVDTTKHPVLLILSDKKIVDSAVIGDNRQVRIERFEPGDYTLRVLYDTNGDLQWTPGNYQLRRQPELGITIKRSFKFIADTENQWDIYLKKDPNQPDPDDPYQLHHY